ncbi:MAG: hypothetical protein HY599_04415 [Candidatus Omnitrophica bacterium]|nr:hypothetical protein [Candidatus Omnitrophota bacterium]
MKRPEGFLEWSIVIFKGLAWLSLIVQVAVGLIVLVVGGAPVPIGGVDIPARLVGLLNCVAGAVYFFMLLLVAKVIRVLLDIHRKVVGT